MAAEGGESNKVTELLVRMDCNGCVQRIKKALKAIEGVYEIYIDPPQQKLTVVGKADPEQILKAIKRTKKTATICSHVDPAEPAPPPNEQPPSGDPPAPTTDAPPLPEPPKDQEPDLEAKPAPITHMVHEYPHEFAHRDYWNTKPYYENSYNYATHSYNSHRPSDYVSHYENVPVRMAPRENRYGNEYPHSRESGDGGQVTSMFSDENPNACTIV